MAQETYLIRLRAQDETQSAVASAKQGLSGLGSAGSTAVGKFQKSLQDIKLELGLFAGMMTSRVTTPIVNGFKEIIGASADYQLAFAGVMRVTDGLGDSVHNLTPLGHDLYQAFQDLSKEMPISAVALAGIGEEAGKLGIPAQNVEEFTRVVAGMSLTTNLSAQEAATAMAKIALVTGMPLDAFNNLGSAVLHLGNILPATEADIVNMALRMAGTASTVDISADSLVGWAGAMASVGIRSEEGGSAMSRVWQEMAIAVSGGGEKLEEFARVAGMTSSDFARLFGEDASEASARFIEGIGKMKNSGEDVFSVLDSLGLNNIRVNRTILTLASSEGLLRDTLDESHQAFRDGTALGEATGIMYGTTSNQAKMFKNSVSALARSFGDLLLPMLNELMELARPIIEKLTDMDDGTKKIVMAVALGVAALGALAMVAFVASLALSTLLSPVGLVIMAIAAVVAIVAAFIAKMGGIEPAIQAVVGWFQNLWTSITTFFGGLWESISTALSDTWESIIGFFTGNYERIKSSVTGAFEAAKAKLDEVWNSIKTALSDAWEAVVSFLTENYERIKSSLTSAFEAAKTKLDEVWDSIKTALSDAWEAVVSFLTENYERIKSKITLAFEDAKIKLDEIWDSIKTALSDTWESIRDFLAESYDTILDALKKPYEKAKEIINDALNSCLTFITEVWGNIKGFLDNKYNEIKDALTAPFNAAKEAIGKVIDGIEGFIRRIKLPHLRITWESTAIPGVSIPHFNVDWYGKGVDAIFDKPTLIGVGENGPERVTVAPLVGPAVSPLGKDTGDGPRPVDSLIGPGRSSLTQKSVTYNYNFQVHTAGSDITTLKNWVHYLQVARGRV